MGIKDVLSHKFFNKKQLALKVMNGKNTSRGVLFYRKEKNDSFTDVEVENIKKELLEFANLILKVCKDE